MGIALSQHNKPILIHKKFRYQNCKSVLGLPPHPAACPPPPALTYYLHIKLSTFLTTSIFPSVPGTPTITFWLAIFAGQQRILSKIGPMIFVFSIYNNDANSARSVWKKYLTFQNCEIYFNSSVERILYHHITINTSHCDACDNGMKFFILSPQSPQSLQFKQSPQSLQVRLAHLRVDFRAFFYFGGDFGPP